MKLAKKRRKLRVIRPDTVIESEKSREDKSRNLKIKVITIIGIVCALLLAIYLFCVYRTYNNYKVRKTIKIETGTNSQYQAFGEFVVKYSNDGISSIRRPIIFPDPQTIAILHRFSSGSCSNKNTPK